MSARDRGASSGTGRRARWWWLVLLGAQACGGAAARGEPSTVRADAFWLPYLREEGAGPGQGGRGGELRGKLFVIRVDGPWLTTSTWVKCPVEATYRYEAIRSKPQRVELTTVEEAARFLPHGYQFFADALGAGGRVQVEYVVVGRYKLAGDEARIAGIVCNAASHYAGAIVVGAYRVTMLDHGAPRAGATRVEAEGTIDECMRRAPEATGPIEGCKVPLAYELEPLVLPRGQARLHISDSAEALELPSSSTMPWRAGAEDVPGG